jgi:1-deoxy-D-xylulose-5-phosphate reductoisomerase
MTRKRITILGSTGSVGVNTLRVISEHPDEFEVAGLASAGANLETVQAQIKEFSPHAVYVKDEAAALRLKKLHGCGMTIFTERDGLRAFSSSLDADILVAASSGATSLLSVLDALEKGRRVALANKELLVMAGALVLAKLRLNPKASLLPIDSEHSAIFQCLEGGKREEVEKLILTGSGGPLREVPRDRFLGISKEVVINHPKWKMGKKISVDSATLMNKGLEIIEASWLFGLPVNRIEVLIHPEAIIHSMVEFCDGSVIAQLGVTDMRMPIRYALSYPERLPAPSTMKLNFATISKLSFSPPDRTKFPCLDLAYAAALRSGSAPCVLSAADEVAVEAFLTDRIDFTQIPDIIEKVLSNHRHVQDPDLGEIQSIHAWATEETEKHVRES